MTLLDALERSGRVRAVDIALARSLARADADLDDRVALAAALASYAVSQGHTAFELARPLGDTDARDIAFPTPESWQPVLMASRWVAVAAAGEATDAGCALVLEAGHVYLRRYREYEHRLATALARLDLIVFSSVICFFLRVVKTKMPIPAINGNPKSE